MLLSFLWIYHACRIYTFLDTDDSLFEQQYGFWPCRSCEHALLIAQNSI